MTTENIESTGAANDLQVLYDALTSAAGEEGRTRVGYDEALRNAGAADQFTSNGELDEERVEAAARGLIEQGLLEVRGPGYKYVGAAVGRPSASRGRAASGRRGGGRGRAAARSGRSSGRAAARGGATRGRKAAQGAASSNGRRTRKSTSSQAAPRKSAAGRPPRAGAGSGSPYLAESLSDLLNQMTSEVGTVSALSARIDDASRSLQTLLAEYVDRIGTLALLRATTSGGPLAQFLADELRPERPTELEALDAASARAQAADV